MAQQMRIDVAAMVGKPVYSSDGASVGQVSDVLVAKETADPGWLALRRGLLGGERLFVPIAGATLHDDRISVPHTEHHIEQAPKLDGEEVSEDAHRRLSSHYRTLDLEDRLPSESRERRGAPTAARTGTPGEGGRKPSDRTRDELYAEASRLGIEGRSKMNKPQLAEALARHRGESADPTAKANPIEVQKFLEGVDYPTRKADLVRAAKRQGADATVRATLERIRDEKFDSPADVSEAIGRLS